MAQINKDNSKKQINEITWADCKLYLDGYEILIPDSMVDLLDQYKKAWREGKEWAIKDMLNRRFGTPTQKVDVTSKEEQVSAGIFIPKDLKD